MRKRIYFYMKSGRVVKVKATSWQFRWDEDTNLVHYKLEGMPKGNHIGYLNLGEVAAVKIK